MPKATYDTTTTTPAPNCAVKRPTRRKKPASFVPPDMPPKTEAEQEADRRLLKMMTDLLPKLQQTNLNRAVLLAEMAAEGRGPLIDHFAELGRRYAGLLRADPPRLSLRLIEGGVR